MTDTKAPATKKPAAAKKASTAKKSAARKAAAPKVEAPQAPEANPAEDAVRNYLRFLEDPTALVDAAAVKKAEAAVAAASDPIDKLKAIAAREAIATPDETALRTAFITHAKIWAGEAGISPKIFLNNMSVPVEVLRAAGFEVAELREVNGTRAKAKQAGGGRQRAKAVPVEDIQEWIRQTPGKFILTDVIEQRGGSQATVRKALDDMISAGEVTKIGAQPEHTGRGRAPIEYVLTKNHKG